MKGITKRGNNTTLNELSQWYSNYFFFTEINMKLFLFFVSVAFEFLSEHRRRRRLKGEERNWTHPHSVPQPAAEEHRSNSHWCAGRRLQVRGLACSSAQTRSSCCFCVFLWFEEIILTDWIFCLFQAGILWAKLPVLHHSAATIRGHQTLLQAGDVHRNIFKVALFFLRNVRDFF